eukprot:378450-Hanusia_phi.AAC.3
MQLRSITTGHNHDQLKETFRRQIDELCLPDYSCSAACRADYFIQVCWSRIVFEDVWFSCSIMSNRRLKHKRVKEHGLKIIH